MDSAPKSASFCPACGKAVDPLRAGQVAIFFADLLGSTDIYNVPGLVSDENWILRTGNDFAFVHSARIAAGRALSVPRALATALRALTVRLPHPLLSALCSLLNLLLAPYIWACRVLPLPLRDYAVNTLGRLSWRSRKLVIYDQLNPSYVHFYERAEVEALLRAGGFERIELYHRRGYSWTALGTR